jgi:hypothetical protein
LRSTHLVLTLLKSRNVVIAGFFGAMVALGIFVNALFLLATVASLCGVMHLFGGHHGGAEPKHDVAHGERETEPSANDS